MRRLVLAFTLALPLATAVGSAQSAGAAPPSSGLQLDAMDRSADPCTDFYQFACGGWIARNPIPADRASWGRFEELQERNNDTLHTILERAAAGSNSEQAPAATPTTREGGVTDQARGGGAPRANEEKKIGDYYASCMDEPGINTKGTAPLDPLLKKIAGVSSFTDLSPLVAELHTIGVNVFFSFGAEADFKDASVEMAIADQGGMGLPDRDYYLREDPKSVEQRKQYVEHVGKMLSLAGSGSSTAANGVMTIETALAKGALDNVSRRDPTKIYHKLTPAELQFLTPQFLWQKYFDGISAPPIYALNVTEPDFFKAMGQLMASASLDDIKTYLRWQVLHASAPVLPTPFVDENFTFYGTVLTGVTELRPRWKRCVQYTDSDLGEELGKAYVKEAFGPQAKADTLEMVHEVESSLEKDIHELSWMTEMTKKEALVKLHAVTEKIGYPDRWRDYSAVTIVRGDALGNSQRANAFEFHRQLNKIGKPVDKTEWGMTPPTVNAYYNPLENNINFPAGILQPPFFERTMDDAVNFGGIGAVIGHELTHGFDDQGRKFGPDGNLTDWWTEQDGKEFEKRASCIADEYGSFVAVDDLKLNGKLTLGENTADNGGARIALMALREMIAADKYVKAGEKIDGYTPEQRFFLG